MNTSQALLRTYLFVGGIVLIAVLLVYSGVLVKKMEGEVEAASYIFAQFAASSAAAVDDPRTRDVYRDVITRIHFPIILTDTNGRPRVWRHIGVDLDEVTEHEIQALDLDAPPESGPIARVLHELGRLDEQKDPIAIRLPSSSRVLGYVHYGTPPLIVQLRLFPFLELCIVVIFLMLAVVGYRSVKDSEQRSVWIGMAKETAHQLGTPISSLMGWLEVLADRIAENKGGTVELQREFVDEVVVEMENDVARLSKVAARFSNVGSVPRLEQQDIVPVVAEAAQYLRRRLPQMGSRVEIIEELPEVPPININRELMEWVFENLLRNALDSVDREHGVIKLIVHRDPHIESVDVRVEDNGRGMTPAEQSRVFEPGFSTKRRGWGLGLSLSRRIVEDYHGGRLILSRSEPGEGTTFTVRFPL